MGNEPVECLRFIFESISVRCDGLYKTASRMHSCCGNSDTFTAAGFHLRALYERNTVDVVCVSRTARRAHLYDVNKMLYCLAESV